MNATIVNLEEEFFKKVGEDDDINAIMARGEMALQQQINEKE